MARTFVTASSQYLEIASAVLSAVEITMACWYNVSSLATSQALMCIGNSGAGDRFELLINGSTNIQATAATSSAATASSSTAPSTGVWQHACGVFTSATSRAAFLNGGGKGTNATNRTPSGVNQTAIGRRNNNSPGLYVGGRIMEAGIWNTSLTDAEVASLAAGMCPLSIRPASLVAYWPLFGNDATEFDRWKNRSDLTVTGATKGDHGRIYYQPRAIFVPKIAPVVAASFIPRRTLTGVGL